MLLKMINIKRNFKQMRKQITQFSPKSGNLKRAKHIATPHLFNVIIQCLPFFMSLTKMLKHKLYDKNLHSGQQHGDRVICV